jgi:hypothetical protein
VIPVFLRQHRASDNGAGLSGGALAAACGANARVKGGQSMTKISALHTPIVSTLLDALPYATVMVDREGRITIAIHLEGVGPGLAIAKRIAEVLGGSLGVDSIVGQGSTFFAILPRTHGVQP